MSSPYQLHVTAAQVASYFVGQYYQVLQKKPDFVHQFYTDASTKIHIDGGTIETANGMLQIHKLVKTLDYHGVEISTVYSLESWNRGVMVMITGAVHTKITNARRKFAQTFFLAPQEKGYFVFNDIFHFIDNDSISPLAYFPNKRTQTDISATTQGTAANFMLVGDTHPMEYTNPVDFKENGALKNYSFSDSLLLHVEITSGDKFANLSHESIPDAATSYPSNGSIPNAATSYPSNGSILNAATSYPSNGSIPSAVTSYLSPPTEEPAEEPQKHTYASIVTKGQPVPLTSSQTHFNKSVSAPEWNHVPEPQRSVVSATAIENSPHDAEEESPLVEEGEIKSVYVRNLPHTVSASEIEEEFKKFGKLGPDAVAIRNRRDIGVCYAFVEFDDITGVQNAIKAGSVEIAGHQLFIEERRANKFNGFRGGRRGRFSYGGYQYDGPRGGSYGGGRYGGRYGQDGAERDYHYNRGRGNGYYRPSGRQEKGAFVSKATQDQSEYE